MEHPPGTHPPHITASLTPTNSLNDSLMPSETENSWIKKARGANFAKRLGKGEKKILLGAVGITIQCLTHAVEDAMWKCYFLTILFPANKGRCYTEPAFRRGETPTHPSPWLYKERKAVHRSAGGQRRLTHQPFFTCWQLCSAAQCNEASALSLKPPPPSDSCKMETPT